MNYASVNIKVLGRLLNSAVTAGKFVRSETDISKGAVSISSAAVELALNKNAMRSISKPLSEMRIAIVGALVERFDIESYSEFSVKRSNCFLLGSFSVVSTPNFARNYSLKSS